MQADPQGRLLQEGPRGTGLRRSPLGTEDWEEMKGPGRWEGQTPRGTKGQNLKEQFWPEQGCVCVISTAPLPLPTPPGSLGRVWGGLKFCIVFST